MRVIVRAGDGEWAVNENASLQDAIEALTITWPEDGEGEVVIDASQVVYGRIC